MLYAGLSRSANSWGLAVVAAGVGFLTPCSSVLGQDPQTTTLKRLDIRRTDTRPVIDGSLDDEAWSDAAFVEDFHQIRPNEYTEASQQTRVYVTYDDDALYVAARLSDNVPGGVTAQILKQGEMLWDDDFFMLILDPFLDRRSGYRFQTNPNGVRREALFANSNQTVDDWQGIWRVESAVDESGWTTELEIPFKTLSFNPNDEEWGINFSRGLARSNEFSGWVSRNQNQDPSIAGIASGLTGLRQGLGLDLVPSVSVRHERDFALSVDDSHIEPSFDLFYKFSPALTGSLTVNTDFSATEVDDRQVNLTRFSLFFPEKRDFFLQDADIFEFGRIRQPDFQLGSSFSFSLQQNGRPFFSRRIGLSASGQPVDLNYGAKLTGRSGRWNLGTLAIRQDASGDIEPTDILVTRASANVLSESSIGVIGTYGDPRSNLGNSLVGVDFLYRNSRLPGGRIVEGEVWYQQSNTEGRPDEDRAFGLGIHSPNRTGLRGGAAIKEIAANFHPALGFVSARGIRDHTMYVGHTTRPRDGYFAAIFTGVDAQRVESLEGGLDTQAITWRALELENRPGDTINFRYTANSEVLHRRFEISSGVFIPPGSYAFDEAGFELETGNQRRIAGGFGYADGDFYDGTRETMMGSLTWRPSRHLGATLEYEYHDVEMPHGDFVTRLLRTRADWAFSSTLSWVNLIQYDNESEVLGFNSRLHWIPQAGREAYVVLNHNMQDLDRDNSFSSTFSDLAVKFNYTFRF